MKIKVFCAALVVLASASLTQADTIVYSEGFGGTAGVLNGTTVDNTNVAWLAATVFTTDGVKLNLTQQLTNMNTRRALLPVNLQLGNVYYIEADMQWVSSSGTPAGWLFLGFTDSASTAVQQWGSAVPKSWVLANGSGGTALFDGGTAETGGGSSGNTWPATVRLELDYNGTSSKARTLVNGTVVNGSVNNGWFALANVPAANSYLVLGGYENVTGSFDNLEFGVIPEPSALSLVLGGLGLLALLRRRR